MDADGWGRMLLSKNFGEKPTNFCKAGEFFPHR